MIHIHSITRTPMPERANVRVTKKLRDETHEQLRNELKPIDPDTHRSWWTREN